MKTAIKQTHIQKQRMEGLAVKEFFKSYLGLTELDHNTVVYDIGLLFLNEFYPINDPVFVRYYVYHERQKTFWQWWKAQWHIFSQDYVKFITEHDARIDYNSWCEEMMQLVHDRKTELSFETYLKCYRNVKI